MPFQVSDPELEQQMLEHVKRQPFRTSKIAIAEAILRRAVAMPPDQFDEWISAKPDPRVNHERSSNPAA